MAHIKLSPISEPQRRPDEARSSRIREAGRQEYGGKNFAALLRGNGLPAVDSPHSSPFEQVLGDSMGLSNARAMATLTQLMDSGGSDYSTLDTLRNVINSRSMLTAMSGRFVQADNLSGPGIVQGRINRPAVPHNGKRPNAGLKNPVAATAADDSSGHLGALAARFESGSDGAAAIGYDRHGGTSYGKFQLSSRAGTMDQFISFLKRESPAWGERLDAAGSANTGGRSGAMPRVWKEIAAENPALFEEMQTRFVYDNHFQPAVLEVGKRTGLDFNAMSPTMREVLWSTAVQHGVNGAARLFTRAVNQLGDDGVDATSGPAFEKALITKLYALRSDQFGSSEMRVQNAVQNRLVEERDLALAMMDTSRRT